MMPVLVSTFHPVHKLQALALVVVTSSKLDAECVLVVSQIDTTGFVQSLSKYHLAMILMTGNNLFFANKQLGEHHTWQVLLLGTISVQYPVHTIQSAQQYFAILFGKDSTGIKLVALQTIGCAVVVQTVVVHTVLVVTLYHNTAHTTACGYPDAVVLILGNTADVIITQALLLGQIVELVGL